MQRSQRVTFNREIDIREEVDVFVAGGGPAGIAAALAAVRQGAKVFLAEKEVCLGGMGTAGGVSMFCVFTDGVNFVADGVGRMVYDRIFALGGVSPRNKKGDNSFFFRTEVLKRVYDELFAENNIEVSFATQIIALESNDGNIQHVVCSGKSGIFAVKAKAYVDATGDGDLAFWAGAEYEKGNSAGHMQPATFVSMWSGIDWARAEKEGHGVWCQEKFLNQAIEDGLFTVPDPSMPGILPTSDHSGNGVIGHLFGVDGTDEKSITFGAVFGRKIIWEYEQYYKKYLKGYESMELISMGSVLGIRETRRIIGDYILDEDDYWGRAVFADEIGRYCYGIDIHARTSEEALKSSEKFAESWLAKGESYGIPYRTLTPKGLRNILCCGRCISVDHTVLASLRVMPGCFITGQAAGVAAAHVADTGISAHDIDVKQIQRSLIALGAYLPNAQDNEKDGI